MAENFVDIVGYQLEKIHTGMIAWLLDSERSPLPLAEQTEVIAKLAPDFLPEMNVTEVKSIREYSFGRRLRIDLVLELNREDRTKTYLLIECKTDSDVSVDQLTRSAEAFSEQKPDDPFSVIVLAVGAGQFTLTHQLQDIQKKKFHAIDLLRALEIFSGLSIAGKSRVYDDWIASLQGEHTRTIQIDEALAGLDCPGDTRLLKTGYRPRGFSVFYMFYDKLRVHLENGLFQGWAIYSGHNNPVMNWEKGWIPVDSGSDAIELYWEFNGDTFRLKADIKEQTAARWDRWQEIRTCLVELCESCPIAGCKTPNRTGKSVTAYKWEFDFCNETLSVIASKTNKILSHLHGGLSGIQ